MGVKVLTDKYGSLQGVNIDSVVAQAYGKHAVYQEDPEGDALGLVLLPQPDRGPESFKVVDHVIEIHEQ